jgi:hypothetical protein
LRLNVFATQNGNRFSVINDASIDPLIGESHFRRDMVPSCFVGAKLVGKTRLQNSFALSPCEPDLLQRMQHNPANS